VESFANHQASNKMKLREGHNVYTIAVVTICISLVLMLGALAFVASVILLVLRAGIKALVAVCASFPLKTIRLACHTSARRDYDTSHAAVR
jgi:hypothetical protein